MTEKQKGKVVRSCSLPVRLQKWTQLKQDSYCDFLFFFSSSCQICQGRSFTCGQCIQSAWKMHPQQTRLQVQTIIAKHAFVHSVCNDCLSTWSTMSQEVFSSSTSSIFLHTANLSNNALAIKKETLCCCSACHTHLFKKKKSHSPDRDGQMCLFVSLTEDFRFNSFPVYPLFFSVRDGGGLVFLWLLIPALSLLICPICHM